MDGSTTFLRDDRRAVLVGCLFVFIGALGFSSKAILIKLAYGLGGVDAISLLALRMAISLPFFLIAAIWLGCADYDNPMLPKDWATIVGLGVIGYYFASFLDFKGLTYISAGLERLVLFLYPTLVVLFSALIFRTGIRFVEGMALLLSYAGIGLVVSENLDGRTDDLWIGVGLVFGSAVAFAIYMMGSGLMVRRIGSLRFTCYSMIVACLATGFHFGLQSEKPIIGLPSKVYWLALLMALLSTVLPAFCMNAGIRRLGSAKASIISSVGPVATLILAYLVLDEALTPIQLAGTFLVLLGVYLITRFSSRRGA